MKTVYSDKHSLHAPTIEIDRGRFLPFRETPARLTHILRAIDARSLGPVLPPQDHGMDPIRAVHSEPYLEYLANAYKDWLKADGNPDGIFPDTWAVRQFSNCTNQNNNHPVHKAGILGKAGFYACDSTAVIVDGTWQAAYEAVQVVLTAADLLLEEKAVEDKPSATYALCRPPGHHSHSDLAAGYCFLNNAAIATRYLQQQKNIQKIAILDIDYHHGNGTQHTFYAEQDPLYVSLHAYPEYPYFWGSADEKGEGAGLGFNVNVPLKLGTTPEEYLEKLDLAVNDHIIPYKPDILVVSLGVDTFVDDPVGGGIFLTTSTYLKIGAAIARIRRPTLFVMEGGYALDSIGENVCNVLVGFETER